MWSAAPSSRYCSAGSPELREIIPLVQVWRSALPAEFQGETLRLGLSGETGTLHSVSPSPESRLTSNRGHSRGAEQKQRNARLDYAKSAERTDVGGSIEELQR